MHIQAGQAILCLLEMFFQLCITYVQSCEYSWLAMDYEISFLPFTKAIVISRRIGGVQVDFGTFATCCYMLLTLADIVETEVDALLDMARSLLVYDPSQQRPQLIPYDRAYPLFVLLRESIPMMANAYGNGLITLERLLLVVMVPLLRILQRVNEIELSAEWASKLDMEVWPDENEITYKQAMDNLLNYWYVALDDLLNGKTVFDSERRGRIVPLLSLAKREKAVQAMLKANIHKVCNTDLSIFCLTFTPQTQHCNFIINGDIH